MAGKHFFGTSEAAQLLKITTRRVVGLCREGKLEGAYQEGRNWRIPEGSLRLYRRREKGNGVCGEGRLLPCSIGNSSFIDLSQNCYYVDKTLLIKELIDDHNQVTLFARPRRFGKTTAMNMLKAFFEHTDEDTSAYFKDTEIWNCGMHYQKEQGKYPVVFISFKDIKYRNWKDSVSMLNMILQDEFCRHGELFKSTELDEKDRLYLDKVIKEELPEDSCTTILTKLTHMLEKHHHSKVVVLIDEYDTMIIQGYTCGFYEEVITFMRNFMSSLLKDNSSLAFGVLTGILRVSKESLFSGLNNLCVNTVLDQRYSEYFGFTADEVEEMAVYYDKKDKLPEIQLWYNGYRFGSTDIYNPWSVTNYFNNLCVAKPFWVNTSDNAIIKEILAELTPENADRLTALLRGESVQTCLNMEVIYPKIMEGSDIIFSFLLMTGYLRILNTPKEADFGTLAELEIPNAEIRRAYTTEILAWMRQRINYSVVNEMPMSLLSRDVKRFNKALQNFLRSSISYFDGASESFYHGLMMGLVACLSTAYYIRSNRESGDGRFDLMLTPKYAVDDQESSEYRESYTRGFENLPGIVMELKAVKATSEEELKAAAKAALLQIEQKHYDEGLTEQGIKEVVKYGIAFCGKNAEVLME